MNEQKPYRANIEVLAYDANQPPIPPITLRALVYGQLAVVRVYPDYWTVTHVLSGFALAYGGTDYKAMHQLARQIEGLYDYDAGWDTYQETGEWPDKEARMRVKALVCQYEELAEAESVRRDAVLYSEQQVAS